METRTETRLRFAPSPTGNLHIGGMRTALFNWLYARATGGKFLLRIEDTDTERSKPEYTKDILQSLHWLGMESDESAIYQSKRFDIHRSKVNELVEKKLAYRCECTPEMLDQIKQECRKKKEVYRYPGTCRNKENVGAKYVVRLKMPENGETAFEDLIRGEITYPNSQLDDWIVLRSNGVPTYNLCVVVDDHDMEISHVVRGEDHINNTPKQIHLYRALGWAVPKFAHVPMILGQDRSKLSKRHGARSTLEYRSEGFLPITIINFLARLGWSHGDQEKFNLEELKRLFSLEKVGKANAIFNTEKLEWLNGQFIKELPSNELLNYIRQFFSESLEFANGVSDAELVKALDLIKPKVRRIPEIFPHLESLFGPDPSWDGASLSEEKRTRFLQVLTDIREELENSDFTKGDLENRLRGFSESRGLKFGKMAEPIRFAMTGGKVSPGIFELLALLGKETTLRRIELVQRVLQ